MHVYQKCRTYDRRRRLFKYCETVDGVTSFCYLGSTITSVSKISAITKFYLDICDDAFCLFYDTNAIHMVLYISRMIKTGIILHARPKTHSRNRTDLKAYAARSWPKLGGQPCEIGPYTQATIQARLVPCLATSTGAALHENNEASAKVTTQYGRRYFTLKVPLYCWDPWLRDSPRVK